MKKLKLWLLYHEAVLKVSFMYGRKGSFLCIEIVCVCGLTVGCFCEAADNSGELTHI